MDLFWCTSGSAAACWLRKMAMAAATPEPSEKDKRILAVTTRSSRLGIYAIIGGQHLFNYLSRFVSH